MSGITNKLWQKWFNSFAAGRVKALLCAVILFAVNLAIAQRLFTTEFTQHMGSNEGSFMAISRFILERWPHISWYPFWLNGVPFENTYSPMLQIIDALFAKVAHCSTALAFHAVVAFFYCLGPVLLFWFAWRLSGLLIPSFLASFFYSVASPSLVFPAVRGDVGGWFHLRRLHTLVYYGEGAHNVVLSLLPLALLFAWLAITRRRYRWYVATGLTMAALVLTNAFAAVDLVIAGACLAVVQPRGQRLRSLALLAGIGVVAYVVICPFFTPTLIQTIRINSVLNGDYRVTPEVIGADVLILSSAAALWWLTRTLVAFDRFAYLIAYVFFAIPALAHFAKILVLPQAERYHLEMEMGVCLALFFLVRRWLQTPVVAVVIVLLIVQSYVDLRFARGLIGRIDITQTIQYKEAKWIDANLRGLRSMVSGDAGLWFNLFTDNPQLSSGHIPFTPNWMIQIATYAIYTGQNAGDRDAANSILWLKAYGCHAITIPGPDSRLFYKPYWHPRKFDGVLPVLWHDGDDWIYAVPQRSKSLAHVIPMDAAVSRPPIHGLDTAEVARYVAALEDPSLPIADAVWLDPGHAHIQAPVLTNQAVSVQVTYDPGWVATANGQPVAVTRDGIGLILIQPKCNGPCSIDLFFEGGRERKLCRITSVMALLGVLLGSLIRYYRKVRRMV